MGVTVETSKKLGLEVDATDSFNKKENTGSIMTVVCLNIQDCTSSIGASLDLNEIIMLLISSASVVKKSKGFLIFFFWISYWAVRLGIFAFTSQTTPASQSLVQTQKDPNKFSFSNTIHVTSFGGNTWTCDEHITLLLMEKITSTISHIIQIHLSFVLSHRYSTLFFPKSALLYCLKA